MLGYPSDIQLFLSKEAQFLAAWDPGFQEALCDSSLLPVSRVGLTFHRLCNGAHMLFPFFLSFFFLSLLFLLLELQRALARAGARGLRRRGMAQECGQAGPHHPEELCNSSWGAHRPMPVWQEPLCMQVWWELGQQGADMAGFGGSGFSASLTYRLCDMG